MMYVDYNLDIGENALILDKDLKLKEQSNENGYGNLPESWKQGDLFEIKIGPTGRVTFVKKV
jgi:hypothetical protein